MEKGKVKYSPEMKEQTVKYILEGGRSASKTVTEPELTREMELRLIDFITVDRCPGKCSKEPREIHIYYKHLNAAADNTTNRITAVNQ